MTSKELLYVEDALGHEQFFQSQIRDVCDRLQDNDLKLCAQQMAQKHQQIFTSLYGLLNQ